MNVTVPIKRDASYGTSTLQPGLVETVEKKPEKQPKKERPNCHIVNNLDRRFSLCGTPMGPGCELPLSDPASKGHASSECAGRGCTRCPECERINAIIRGYR